MLVTIKNITNAMKKESKTKLDKYLSPQCACLLISTENRIMTTSNVGVTMTPFDVENEDDDWN